MGQDHIFCYFVITELEDFGLRVNSLSLYNQSLPFKKGLYIDQTHTAQVHINLDHDHQLYMVSIPPLNESVTMCVVPIQ